MITRGGHESVVIISLEDFESLRETAYLVRSPENARRLLDAVERLEAGSGEAHDSLESINRLIQDVIRNGNEGIGTPEPLKHDVAGYWSRRITDERRHAYKVADPEVPIAACRYHYGR